MYKVVLVDDEMLVKLGLRTVIDWNQEGFEIVGEAASGREGVRLILETNPDLVISDIVMPEMDGIEMYAAVKEQGRTPILVVLSSYDQFDLVKRAIKIGARDYLLKLQLSTESIHELLQGIRQELDERAESVGEENAQEVDISELNRIYLYGLLLGENINQAYIRQCFLKSGGQVRVLYIATDASRIIGSKTERERKVYNRTLRSLLDDICREFGEAYCIEWENCNFVVIVQADEQSDSYYKMAEAIMSSLDNYGNLQSSVGISSVVSLTRVQDAYNMAKLISEDLKYNGYGKAELFETEEVINYKNITIEENDILDSERLVTICEMLKEGELQQFVSEFNFNLKSHHLSVEEASFQSTKLICIIEEHLKNNWRGLCFQHNAGSILSRIYRSQSVGDIIKCNREYINMLEKEISEYEVHDVDRIVQDAKKYIKQHINENISLRDIAEELDISPSYLSTVFSQNEKLGLMNYINREKIKKAQQLMLQDRMKVYEVSYMLGFESASYFAKVFKKFAGCSPKQFVSGKTLK